MADFPDALQFLFEPARYKVLWGGRGGAKSWGVARALLIQGTMRKLKVLCAREFQNSLDESVHQLLENQIDAMGLRGFYDVQKAVILGKNGTEFTFSGLRHKVNSIKSAEGIDVCWVEEAVDVSKNTWEKLIPTIRKDRSEIWVTFNPELATDETYKRFVLTQDPDAIVRKIDYKDNPWFPPVLERERTKLKASDPDAYQNIWEGHPRQWLDGAIYANEIRLATEQGRITAVPYHSDKPVHTAWDLGESDMTAIWFYQRVGFQWHVIDYYENSGHKTPHYLKELQSRPYVYGTIWLPHDAFAEHQSAEKTIARQVKDAGYTVREVPKMSIANGINAARSVFDLCVFDEAKCSDGLNCLRHYQYKVDPKTEQRSKEPLHNWASHGADAFRYLAVSLKEPTQKPTRPVLEGRPHHSGTSWMGL